MGYTLGEAAKATGLSKATLSRAIKKGRISAEKREDGSYLIDPAELHRIYPPVSRATSGAPVDRATHETDHLLRIRELETRLEATERMLADRDRQLDREREISTDLQQDRDHWRQQATALLTDQRERSPQKATEGRWRRAWSILRGKA